MLLLARTTKSADINFLPQFSFRRLHFIKEILKYKKFVRFEEGAALYSIGKGSFRQLAADAHAVYHIRKIALVNVEKIDRFLEENCCDYLDGIEEDAYDPLVKAGKRTQKYNFQEEK